MVFIRMIFNLLTLFLLLIPSHLAAESTPPIREHPQETVKIGFGSCWSAQWFGTWKTLSEQKFDRFVMLGDGVYLPTSNLPDKWVYTTTFDQLMQNREFQLFRNTTPVSAIWDDHDYGPSNGDSSYIGRNLAEEMFRQYWNLEARPKSFQKGIHRSIQHGFLKIILTDNRSFRNDSGPKKKRSLFGDAQLQWIIEEIENAGDSFVILASGGQLLTKGPHHEHLEAYPREYPKLIKALSSTEVPLSIISGDRHFADIIHQKHGDKELLEVTSSPLAGRIAPKWVPQPQPGRVGLYRDSANFGSLTITKLRDSFEVTAEIYSVSRDKVLEFQKSYRFQ